MKLAKEGYGAGDPEKVMRMRVDTVMMIMQFEGFTVDYGAEFMALNTKKD